ncbi:MAG TPA: nucleotide exchange factor GrpE [Frankiaceae bacterium]|nr:nucleotide exchange factor GrpE [Frankiaceae bacterium]
MSPAQEGRGPTAGTEEPQVVVRDRRRIDPVSGEVRPGFDSPAATAAPPGPPSRDDDELRRQVAERTADLQRRKAEYDNYRRRVERDRQVAAEQATARVLAGLLPTLDDIGRARDHGDLEGPFKAVADSLESTLDATGLERYGAPGDPFDPLVHDALMHSYRPDVAQPTCVEVLRAGYRYNGRVLRPAQVVVAEPPLEEPLDGPVEVVGEPGSAHGPAPGEPSAGADADDDT